MPHTLPKKLIPFFWHFLKKQPLSFSVLFLAPICIVIETNIIPYALKLVLDGFAAHSSDKQAIFKTIAPALWLGGLSWLVFFVIIRLQNYWQGFVIPKFEADIRLSMVEYITAHSHRYFSDQLSGNLATKINDLPKALESIRMILCWNCVSTLAVVLVSLVMTGMVDPLFAWILGLWIVLHVGISFYFAQKIYVASETNAEHKSAVSGSIVDMLSNITSTKLFARRRFEHAYITEKQSIEQLSNKRLILLMSHMRLFMDILVFAMIGSILYVLILCWQRNTVGIGDVVFIINTSWAVTLNTWFLSHALTDLFREVGIATQALRIITTPHEMVDAPNADALRVTDGTIIFDNVTFHYARNKNLFENKHVCLEAGKKVGLVGFSGSGKTTFVNLILRFFDIEQGRILIDGQDIRLVTQDSLHEAISMIPQDTSLFHRTLMENIRYGKLHATDEEVYDAARNAYCHEFISQLPDGYASLVGERGIKLSGGQRQRIAIARAILKNAPIVILDEATSALDSVTEKQIQEGLHRLMEGRTTLVIAHRLSTLSEVDRILVFNNGHIIEDGTHDVLLAHDGHYARMWRMQAGGFLPENE